jgi:hypothetical protein
LDAAPEAVEACFDLSEELEWHLEMQASAAIMLLVLAVS